MEPNNQLLSYEEFNNMSELDNNFCLLMSNNSNNIDNKDDNDNKIICDSEENKEKEKISEIVISDQSDTELDNSTYSDEK